jgi:hypothetical protein
MLVRMEDLSISPKTTKQNLDEACGVSFTYRDFIECGESWQSSKTDNLPNSPETFRSLYQLADKILDPIVDYFGEIELTFGFCSPALAKVISGRIEPKLDQHAGHELNRRKNLICDRLGASADFIIEDEDMLEVAQWIVENLPFDRLYFYGPDRPLHISYSPEPISQVTVMKQSKTNPNRLVPSTMSPEKFLKFT